MLAVGFDLSVHRLARQRGGARGVRARHRRAPARAPGDRRQPWVLVVAVAATVIVLATFAFTTLVEEPGTAVTLVAILVLSILLDLGWKRADASGRTRLTDQDRANRLEAPGGVRRMAR